ncbi:PREDICTED: interleukin-4 [Leptosomus discolor]|uniref:interleukin-4 n=1 Tax=Leptosomus discolor TaxID=188344 RepID=UPI0005226D37|nr:PREDICTED: interleukin-4 [Leptosomus discolor]
MNSPVPVLLAFLALSACQGHTAARPQTSSFLKESIRLLSNLGETTVSCDKMNVTNIFAGEKRDDDMETLCKATAVLQESQSCHGNLEGVYLNLLKLVQRHSVVHQPPCALAAGNTTSLSEFLEDLRRVLQRLVKDWNLK